MIIRPGCLPWHGRRASPRADEAFGKGLQNLAGWLEGDVEQQGERLARIALLDYKAMRDRRCWGGMSLEADEMALPGLAPVTTSDLSDGKISLGSSIGGRYRERMGLCRVSSPRFCTLEKGVLRGPHYRLKLIARVGLV